VTRPQHTPPDALAGERDPAAKLRAVHQRLTAAVAGLASDSGWQQLLRTAARLPRYSPHNVLLISSQCPHARAVAGFHTWKQLGRAVRKGEQGIAILAPVPRRTAPSTRAPSTPAPSTPDPPVREPAGSDQVTSSLAETTGPGRRALLGFRVVHVFDISQTDGPPLPEPPRPVLLDGQAPPGLLTGLHAQVTAQGYQLIRHDFDLPHPGLGVPNGVTDFFARAVIVRPDLTAAQTAKTLAHELGHVLLHAPAVRPPGLTRPQAEVEAESVAYVVSDAHGLDTSGYTLPYLAGWAGGDLALVAASAERVIATAHTILTRTPPPPTVTLPAATLSRVRRAPARPGPERDPRPPAGRATPAAGPVRVAEQGRSA
jgi:hypothetical protein